MKINIHDTSLLDEVGRQLYDKIITELNKSDSPYLNEIIFNLEESIVSDINKDIAAINKLYDLNFSENKIDSMLEILEFCSNLETPYKAGVLKELKPIPMSERLVKYKADKMNRFQLFKEKVESGNIQYEEEPANEVLESFESIKNGLKRINEYEHVEVDLKEVISKARKYSSFK